MEANARAIKTKSREQPLALCGSSSQYLARMCSTLASQVDSSELWMARSINKHLQYRMEFNED